MIMKKYPFPLIFAGLVFLSSCDKNYVEPKPPGPSGPTGTITTPISFGTDVFPALSGCIASGCHGVGENSPDLSSKSVAYNSLISGTSQAGPPDGPYVDTTSAGGNAAKSVFYKRITATDGTKMPPSGSALSADYTGKVLKWIKEGAKNN